MLHDVYLFEIDNIVEPAIFLDIYVKNFCNHQGNIL